MGDERNWRRFKYTGTCFRWRRQFASAAGRAFRAIGSLARKLGLEVRVAALTGDDVLDALDPNQKVLETGEPLASVGPLFSANAYLGVEEMLPALESGADIVLTGRVADPSLALAP